VVVVVAGALVVGAAVVGTAVVGAAVVGAAVVGAAVVGAAVVPPDATTVIVYVATKKLVLSLASITNVPGVTPVIENGA
jgi:hypothetical protein